MSDPSILDNVFLSLFPKIHGQLSIAFRLLLVYFSHLRLSLGLQHLATIK
jgi:hypothetical protein